MVLAPLFCSSAFLPYGLCDILYDMTIHSELVSHLEGAIDGARLPKETLLTLHNERPIWVRYDLGEVADRVSPDLIATRAPDMWRYEELLPPGDSVSRVTLGEGMSPLLRCDSLAQNAGLENLWIKDESQLPGGSFKSRGISMALTMARAFGVTDIAIPTAGNAGGATATYAARAGLRASVFMPDDTPLVNQFECELFGARLFLVNGLITDCGKIVREGKEKIGWFDLSTLKEPYRIEGKKTMGLELAEQFDWKLPDVILYPTGGGTGLIGMWKAFNELRELGWLKSETMPRMVAVQSNGCCPIVRAFDSGERFAEPFADPQTSAWGIRVPAAVGDFMILDALRESGGCAIAVEEERINSWMYQGSSASGIALCPETGACIGALSELRTSGWIRNSDKVVIFNTGAAQKYPPATVTGSRRIDINSPLDWDAIGSDQL